MLTVRRIPSLTFIHGSFAQVRNLSSESVVDIDEICRITRTKPRWEDTLLSLYPSVKFSDPSFFLRYVNRQNNAFLSLRFLHWLCSHCGFSPDQSSCNALFILLVDAGACKAAKSLLHGMDFTPEPRAFERYVQGLSGAGMVEDAFEALKKEEFSPSVETWNVSLFGCLKARRTDLVWRMYERMMRTGVTDSVDADTVGCLIMAFCAERKVFKGYQLLRQLLENGLHPSKVVFNALIDGFCREKQYVRVSEMLHVMIAKGCDPDVYTYQKIIHGLLKRKNSEGFRIFKDLRERGYFPDRVMYTTVMKGLCEMGQLGEARKLWFEMIGKGILPNEYTYNVMIHGYCKIGDFVEARRLINDMCDRGYAETAVIYGAMISGLCLHGRTDEALSLFEEMSGKGIVRDLIAYNCLIKGLCVKGELIAATKLFDDLLAQGLEPSVFSFVPLIKGLCEAGDTQSAIRLWKDMHDRHLEPPASAHDDIIIGLCKEGSSAQGMEWLVNMTSRKLKPQNQTFEYLINSLLQEDKLDDVLVALDLMLRLGYRLKESIIHSLVRKFSKDKFNFPNLCLEKILERN